MGGPAGGKEGGKSEEGNEPAGRGRIRERAERGGPRSVDAEWGYELGRERFFGPSSKVVGKEGRKYPLAEVRDKSGLKIQGG